jgi:hypothetical protein
MEVVGIVAIVFILYLIVKKDESGTASGAAGSSESQPVESGGLTSYVPAGSPSPSVGTFTRPADPGGGRQIYPNMGTGISGPVKR